MRCFCFCFFVFVCTHHSGACAVSNARKPAATAEVTAARVPPMSPAVPKPRSGSSTPFRSVTLPRIVGSASTACAIAGHGGSHVVFASFTHASSGAVAVSEAAEHDMTSKARAVKRTIRAADSRLRRPSSYVCVTVSEDAFYFFFFFFYFAS